MCLLCYGSFYFQRHYFSGKLAESQTVINVHRCSGSGFIEHNMELEELNVFLSQENETYKLNLNSNWN